MRQGELFALHWEDVDLDNAVLSVRRTLREIGKLLELGEPKSKAGIRSIQLPQAAVNALRSHKDRMESEGHGDAPLVFCDTRGGFLRKSNFRQYEFIPLLKSAGVPVIRFHDLRHTHATLMLTKGVHPKIVQSRLGHSQISMTMDTYSHVLPSLDAEAAKQMDSILSED